MKIKIRLPLFTALLAGWAFLAGWPAPLQAEAPAAARETPLRVLTSFLPLQAHALAIGGEAIVTEQLLSKDTGPHDFQLTPGDVRRVATSDLFFINGGGLEAWTTELVKRAANENLKMVDTSVGIQPAGAVEAITIEGVEASGHDHSHDHSGHSHAHGESCGADGVNPHFWLDPVLALHQARAILAALQEADPAQAEIFARNAENYFAKLEALDQEFRDTLGALENKNLVTFHDAFTYLAARYGLNYVGYIEEFPEKNPTPQQLAALLQAIQENQVGVLFAEKGYSEKLLDRVAEQSRAKVSELDTLELGQGTAEAYIERMRANLEALRQAFAGSPASPAES